MAEAENVYVSSIEYILAEHDIDPTEDVLAQFDVFMDALNVYYEREQQHGSTWKEFDTADAAHHVKHKAARMANMAGREEVDTDEALDAINYAAFFVRHAIGAK